MKAGSSARWVMGHRGCLSLSPRSYAAATPSGTLRCPARRRSPGDGPAAADGKLRLAHRMRPFRHFGGRDRRMMDPTTQQKTGMTSREPADEGIADLRVGDLIQRIAADSVAPGAGAAGAVALALAAACAGKAVSMSFKHTADAHLGTAAARLETLASEALAGADADARTFLEWMRDKSAAARDQLIESEERLARLIEALSATVRDV